MRKALFIFILSILLLHAKCVAQNNTVYGAGISYTNGIPTFVPPSRSARVAIDTVTGKWYEFATPGGWRFAGDRIQRVSGCSAPSYTPTKAQSWIVINGCTEAQNGQGPELYYYTGSNWIFINEKTDAPMYAAGAGIDITGDVITNTAPDQIITISGATGSYPNFTIPTPAVTLNDLTDVTLSSPTNTQVLQYNSAGSQWVNATLSAITGSIANTQVAYGNGTAITGNSSLTYDNSTGRFLLNTATPKIDINASINYLGYGFGYTFNNASRFRFIYQENVAGFYIQGTDAVGNYTLPAGILINRYSNSNVGIGVYAGTNPQSSLCVGGDTYMGGTAYASARVHIQGANDLGTGNAVKVQGLTDNNALIIKNDGDIAMGNSSPVAGAKLEVKSTTGVMVPPNMTTTQRDAIASPPNGIIYNTTTGKLQVYAAGTWVDLH